MLSPKGQQHPHIYNVARGQTAICTGVREASRMLTPISCASLPLCCGTCGIPFLGAYGTTEILVLPRFTTSHKPPLEGLQKVNDTLQRVILRELVDGKEDPVPIVFVSTTSTLSLIHI